MTRSGCTSRSRRADGWRPKALAARMLPEMQEHSALATQTARSVGAEVTATAGAEQKGS